MTIVVVLWCVAAFLALAVLGVMLGRGSMASPAIYGASLVVSLVACGTALIHLVATPNAVSVITLPLGLPWIGAHFRVDALSAFFLVLVDFGAAGSSLYALGYGRHESAPQRVLPFFPAFLAGMNLVVVADDAFGFLVAWEFMSLASWALVMTHHRAEENMHAAYVYLLMASFGTFALLLAFGLLAGADGHYAFESMRAHALPITTASLILVLVLLGAGSKAGLVPLHVWLPLAHPAAPSHVSALMSGVMTKVAVYVFIRICFDLLGGSQAWWWGLVVAGLGGASAVMGVLYGLLQSDLKRVLAYSTIENIGLVFAGLGLALAFRADHLAALAAIAFAAALLHAFNHSLFKSLLFFGAGAVLTSTGERGMNRLGGLIHRMPVTSFTFLVGAAAISALPPLNGFVSEWLTFQAILQSPRLMEWGLKIAMAGVGGLLALAAALAAACFVRAFGMVFLGRPRSEAAAQALEVDRFSLGAMAILAGSCLLAGVAPGFILDRLAPLAQTLVGGHMPQQATNAWLTLVPFTAARSSYNGLVVFAFIAMSSLLSVYAIHRFASHALRRAPAWDCGYPTPDPITQYSAESFAQPIRRVFGTILFRVREVVSMPPPGDMGPARFRAKIRDLIWEGLYAPLAGMVGFVAGKLNYFQFLTIRRYLGLVFVSLVSLLLALAIWM
ncbi:MAG: hydrogenase 4 subunit B [Rhizomicrobium sp.]